MSAILQGIRYSTSNIGKEKNCLSLGPCSCRSWVRVKVIPKGSCWAASKLGSTNQNAFPCAITPFSYLSCLCFLYLLQGLTSTSYPLIGWPSSTVDLLQRARKACSYTDTLISLAAHTATLATEFRSCTVYHHGEMISMGGACKVFKLSSKLANEISYCQWTALSVSSVHDGYLVCGRPCN